ncbi:hypothetical protein ABL78_5885 [Leptomonas seymouri]|uniref:Uncharacterized protein n=1 Tax=Leptomonas seymouri TaxID=5684 RepID=A0A0N0P4P2_LEPSE|nr:hypothetical protein ABL78_5885 [Leptomonas seymouri]|eukprot:KPI85047.1 hypothetical protein ABL78_5885 [Leptomonas seymouri]
MIINEAPWMTRRVVVLLMAGVFALCLIADQLQCSKNGRQTYCTGSTPYHCNHACCRERVSVPTAVSQNPSCRFRGTAEVLLSIVEVGPSLVSERGRAVSAYMAEELRERINATSFTPTFANQTVNIDFRYDRYQDFYAVDEYYKLSRTLQTIRKIPRNTTRYTVANDVIRLRMYEGGRPSQYRNWVEAVEAELPTSRLNNPKQLQVYFPNLYHMLDAAVTRRKKNTAANAKCDAIVLVVYTMLSPLASVRAVWETPEPSLTSVGVGYNWVAGAVTRYISTNKRLLRYVNEVRHVYLYVPPPSRQFKLYAPSKRIPNNFESAPSSAGKLTLTTENAVTKAVSDMRDSLAFCRASTDALRTTGCLLGCRDYNVFSSLAATLEMSLAAAIRGQNGTYSADDAASAVYRNCYFEVLSGGRPPLGDGTFGIDAEANLFDDCFHLSPAGGKAFASCLLKTRAIVYNNNL